MSDFKIGDRVGLNFSKYNHNDSTVHYGVVSDVTAKGKVQVKWDSWKKESFQDSEDLLLENELKEKSDQLANEFEELEKRITAKVKEAADLLIEASDICGQNDLVLYDLYEATRPLLRAMDHAGWNTSSFNC